MARQRRGSIASELTAPSADIIAFIEEFLIVPEGAHVGRKIKLRTWQRDIIRGIYDSPTRQAIISFGRKNAKTTLTAMLVLAHLVGPRSRRNAQIYSAAQSRDQASLVFSLAAKMVRMNRELNELVTVRDSAKELFCALTGVRYKALSADATTAYGLSPVLVIHDELGQVRGPRSELYDALETSMGAQAAPLSIIISTQAPTDADLLSKLIDDAKAEQDPMTKLFLYEAPVDDDPYVETTWRKANPALGDFRSLEDVRDQSEKARRLPSFEAAFRNLILNQRVASEQHFLTRDVWMLNSGAPDLTAFEDADVWGGLDLSARHDMTALIWVTRTGPGAPVHVWPEFFAPAQGLSERGRRDRQPYDLWRDKGILTATPGWTVDYAFVCQRIAQRQGQFNLRQLRYDRWRIDLLRDELNKIGIEAPLEPMGQGYHDMAPALDEFEALALNGLLRHGNHPILTWNAANAIVTKNPAGDRKLDKSKATARIDGLVALAMAIRAMVSEASEAAPEFQMFVLGTR